MFINSQQQWVDTLNMKLWKIQLTLLGCWYVCTSLLLFLPSWLVVICKCSKWWLILVILFYLKGWIIFCQVYDCFNFISCSRWFSESYILYLSTLLCLIFFLILVRWKWIFESVLWYTNNIVTCVWVLVCMSVPYTHFW